MFYILHFAFCILQQNFAYEKAKFCCKMQNFASFFASANVVNRHIFDNDMPTRSDFSQTIYDSGQGDSEGEPQIYNSSSKKQNLNFYSKILPKSSKILL